VNRLLLNNIDVVGVGWGPWIFGNPGYLAQQWAEIGPYLAAGKTSAPQPTTYPLEKAAEALASLENRTANNKVVLTLRPQAHA
jgi:NADPH2:quinone reductase